MAAVDFRILGPVALAVDGQDRHLRPMEQVVLAVLLAENNRTVSLDALVDRVWRGEPPRTATTAIRVHIERLRTAMQRHEISRLVSAPGGYRLVVEREELDALRFEDSLRHGRDAAATDPIAAGRLLREALSEWQGAPFAAIDGIESIDMTRGYLERRRAELLVELAQVELAAGRHGTLVAELRRWCAEFPDSESLAAALVLAQYRCGDQVAALADCRSFQRKFSEEYGLDASLSFRNLELALLRQDPSLDPPPALPTNPGLLDPTVPLGRAGLIASLRALMDAPRPPRVIDLAGSPGVGTTTVLEYLARVHPGALLLPEGGAAFASVLSAAGLVDPPADIRDLATALIKGLRDRGCRVLLVDGADALAADVLALLNALPAPPEGPVILTGGRNRPVQGHPLADSTPASAMVGVTLQPLDAGAARELADALVPASVPERDELVATAVEAAAGDPFLLTSLARHLVAGQAQGHQVPSSIAEFVRSALRALPEACVVTARFAAVDGAEPFEPAVLAGALGSSPEQVIDCAEHLFAAGLLRMDADGLRFRHPLVRQALLDEAAPPDVAAALAAARAAAPAPDVRRTAALWRLAGPAWSTDAATWTAREAEVEASAGAHLRAAELFHQAAVLIGERSDRLAVQYDLASTEELIEAGQLVVAEGRALAVADRARAARLDDLFARAALLVAGPWLPLGAEARQAQHYLLEALEFVAVADRSVRVRLLEGLIRASTGGDTELRAIPDGAAAELTAAADDRDDPATATAALRALGYLAWGQRRSPAHRRELARRMTVAARRAGDQARYVDGLRSVTTSAFELADPQEARASLEQYRAAAVAASSSLHTWWSATLGHTLAVLAGDEPAIVRAQAAVDSAAVFMDAESLAQVEAERILSHAVRVGDVTLLAPVLAAIDAGGVISPADLFVGLARIAVRAASGGEVDPPAVDHLWRGLRRSLRGAPAVVLLCQLLRDAGPAAVSAETRADALAELEPATGCWLQLTAVGALGPADTYLAWLKDRSGDHTAATVHHQRAEAVIARFAPTWRGFSLTTDRKEAP